MSGKYRAVTVLKPPFIDFDDNKQQYNGLLIDLMNEIVKRLNISYSVYTQEDEEYGYLDNEGNWNGIIQDLITGEADIGLAALDRTTDRAKFVDFTVPIYPPTGFSALMQRPIPKTVFFKCFKIMSITAWMCVFTTFLSTALAFWVFDVFSPFSYRNYHIHLKDKEKSKDRRVFTLKESLWFTFTSLTPQGGGISPRNYSSRLVATSWWLFSFIIVASYTANMAARLTLARFDRTIEDFDDLLADYRFRYTTIKNSSVSRYFENRKYIEYKLFGAWKDITMRKDYSLYEKSRLAVWEYPLADHYNRLNAALNRHKKVNSLQEALARFKTKDSKFALITESTDVKYLALTNCTLQEIGPEFSRRPYAIALRKNSPLTEKFNTVIRQLYNEKWMKKNERKWWEKNPKKKKCYDMNEMRVGAIIENVGGVFTTMLVGVVISLVVMAFEYLKLKIKNNKQKNIPKKREEAVEENVNDNDEFHN